MPVCGGSVTVACESCDRMKSTRAVSPAGVGRRVGDELGRIGEESAVDPQAARQADDLATVDRDGSRIGDASIGEERQFGRPPVRVVSVRVVDSETISVLAPPSSRMRSIEPDGLET